MVKTLVLGCALVGSVFYIGASAVDDTIMAAKNKQELRNARAKLF